MPGTTPVPKPCTCPITCRREGLAPTAEAVRQRLKALGSLDPLENPAMAAEARAALKASQDELKAWTVRGTKHHMHFMHAWWQQNEAVACRAAGVQRPQLRQGCVQDVGVAEPLVPDPVASNPGQLMLLHELFTFCISLLCQLLTVPSAGVSAHRSTPTRPAPSHQHPHTTSALEILASPH